MQFDKAEFERAAPEAAPAVAPPSGGGGFARAALYGLGAAIGGSVLFALVSLTGFQFSIVAILVGVMVGKAVRYAVQGHGGLRYQALAVALTYGAITTSYLPGMLWEISKKHDAKITNVKAAVERPAPPARGPLGVALGIVLLIGASLTFPFLFLADNFFSGAINLVIIGIGLRQAWRITAASEAH